ncbi:MAG: acyl-CoA thioesterase [Clostridia bacterium]|nr:acyl-CoA thioesterase [Clostridia bacterium]
MTEKPTEVIRFENGENMFEYRRKINYYETDKMGIVHHSNYVRLMEEARVAFLNSIGFGYDRFEKEGLVSPVVAINCKYRKPLEFADETVISVCVKDFNGVGLTVGYEIRKADDLSLVFTGTSEHCFTNPSLGIVRLKNALPEFYDALMKAKEENQKN